MPSNTQSELDVDNVWKEEGNHESKYVKIHLAEKNKSDSEYPEERKGK